MTWHRDRETLRWIALRYLPWMFALNLTWDAAHVRLAQWLVVPPLAIYLGRRL